jgi:hypothetical protein
MSDRVTAATPQASLIGERAHDGSRSPGEVGHD